MIKLSPTKVNDFKGCRRLFWYKHIAKPDVYQDRTYMIMGNIAHKALEIFHQKYKTMPEDIEEAINTIRSAFKKAIHQDEGDLLTRDRLFEVRDMLKLYIKHIREKGFPEIFSTERLGSFMVGRDIKVWLKADRVDKLGDGNYQIIDYKTSKKPATKKDEQSSLQLPSYGLWLKHYLKKDDLNMKGSYVYLRCLDRKRAGGFRTYDITNEFMDYAVNEYARVGKAIKDREPFERNREYKFCYSCPYKDICDNEETKDLNMELVNGIL